MKTQEEIIKRIEEVTKCDIFGFQREVYISALTFDNAKEYLKEGVTQEEWDEIRLCTDEDVRKRSIEYMPFAWEKANSCRGLSASRSLDRYSAWLWLLGVDDGIDFDDYEFYGKPQLVEICNRLWLDHTEWDDGIRVNSEEEY